MSKPAPNGNARTCAAALAFAVLVALTLSSGGVAGWLDNRWGPPVDLVAAGERLEHVPSRFGDWVLENAHPLGSEVTEVLQCSGSTQRMYRNQKTGEAVSLALIVGPPGPTSVHTPEVCYSSRDYKTISKPKRFRVGTVAAGDANFWGMELEATNLEGSKLSLAYAWNDEHGWVAPERPRFEFGGARLLYKLQLAAAMPDGDQPEQADPCQAFLREFLPELDASLFEAESTKK